MRTLKINSTVAFVARVVSAIIVTLLLVTNAFAATYYIDFVSGSDGNNGTSTATAWQRHPWMANESVNYTPSPGDIFIFKGGVEWTSSTPLTVPVSGTVANWYTLRGDSSWFTGGSWTRPRIKGPGNTGGAHTMIQLSANVSNIVVADLELYDYVAGVGISGSALMYVTVTNCYIHKWWRGSQNGCISGSCNENSKGAIINNYGNNNAVSGLYKFIITHCILNNGDGYTNVVNGHPTGWGNTLQGIGEVYYSEMAFSYWFHDHGGYIFAHNVWHDMLHTTSGQACCHDDFTYLDNCYGNGNRGTRCLFYNNYIYNIPLWASQLIFPNTGSAGLGNDGRYYVFNNVIVNSGATMAMLSIDPYFENNINNTKQIYVFNNSILASDNSNGGRSFVRNVARGPQDGYGNYPPRTCWVINNVMIDSDPVNAVSETSLSNIPDQKVGWNKLFPTGIAAFNDGYTTNGLLAPQNSGADGIGAASNLWNFCVAHDLPTEAFADSTVGVTIVNNYVTGLRRTPIVRPSTGPWDIGAYQFEASSPVITAGQTKYGPVGVALSYQVLAIGGVVSWGASNLPSGLVFNTSSGVISGTPTAVGTNTVLLAVTNANGFDQETMIVGIANAVAVITTEASSVDFGFLRMGDTLDITIGVTNTGGTGTTLTGSATNPTAPWTLIGDAGYSLANGASDTVTLRYSPTTYGTNLGSVSFTGGGGATVALSGIAYNILTNGIESVAYRNYVGAPFVTNGNFISQSVQTTDVGFAGFAIWGFYMPAYGVATFSGKVHAQDESSDSFFHYVDDLDPAVDIWDVIPTNSVFTYSSVNSRGNGTYDVPEFKPKSFVLTEGWHTFKLYGREANARITNIVLNIEAVQAPPVIASPLRYRIRVQK